MTPYATEDQTTVTRYLEEQLYIAKERNDRPTVARLDAVLSSFDRLIDALNYDDGETDD